MGDESGIFWHFSRQYGDLLGDFCCLDAHAPRLVRSILFPKTSTAMRPTYSSRLPPRKRSPLADVARAVEVSRWIAGSVFNGGEGNSRCSKETRDGVVQAARRLNSRPDHAVRQLAGKAVGHLRYSRGLGWRSAPLVLGPVSGCSLSDFDSSATRTQVLGSSVVPCSGTD